MPTFDPILVEEPDTTVVVPPGWGGRRDALGNLGLHRQDMS